MIKVDVKVSGEPLLTAALLSILKIYAGFFFSQKVSLE